MASRNSGASSNRLTMAALPILLVLAFGFQIKVARSIGVCYGRLGNNLPSEWDVIHLYKSYGIGQMRIYDPNHAVLHALRGSNIELLLDVPRSDLHALAADYSAAAAWVEANIRPFSPDVRFKYLAVGNEIKPGEYEATAVLPAMRHLRAALSAAGLHDQIKVSTAIEYGLLDKSYPPSDGAFSDAAHGHIVPIALELAQTGAPLLANIYPYFARVLDQGNVSLEYALFQAYAGGYRSMFDAQVDALYAAMERVGAGGVGIVVSESGWPSAGGTAEATPHNAATYYRSLIQHVKWGTVRKPVPIETYLFALFDENQKTGAETEKYFGLFTPDKQPKYQLSFY